MIVVSNATPLITLAKVGHFELLRKLFTEITISREVWDEVVVKGAGRAGALETANASWIHVSRITGPTPLLLQRYSNLGSGEVSTIILAKELSAGLALIDDRKARALATSQGLRLGGSISVLESAYLQSQVDDLKRIYLDLLAAEIWIERATLNASLAKIGLSAL